MKTKLRWKDMEQEWLTNLLLETKNNLALAAKVSGVCRATLYNKLAEYRLLEWRDEWLYEMRAEARRLREQARRPKGEGDEI